MRIAHLSSILLPRSSLPPSPPQAGFNLDLQGPGGETMLMRASANGAFMTAQALLEAGAKVDVTKGDGRTALMLASLNGQTAMATMLLDRKASIEARSGSGERAIAPLGRLAFAECRCSSLLTATPCRLLAQATLRLSSLASVATVPWSSCSAIEVRDQAVACLGLLVLMLLSCYHLLRISLLTGASTDPRDGDGDSAAELAQRNGHLEVADLIRAAAGQLSLKQAEGARMLAKEQAAEARQLAAAHAQASAAQAEEERKLAAAQAEDAQGLLARVTGHKLN